ncbi:MAG: gluconolaconase, partial [Bacteroidales bacterium]|nr:gluconolaconase [Bacteroidales bacterium]
MKKVLTLAVMLPLSVMLFPRSSVKQGESVYTQKPNDTEAVFFTTDEFNIRADGKTDVSDQLQAAVNKVKTEKNFGIVFLPEGKYLISKTIYIPPAVRLIGYGRERPEIILARNSPGYQT